MAILDNLARGIIRFHATSQKDIPSILIEGIRPSSSHGGKPVVFTSALNGSNKVKHQHSHMSNSRDAMIEMKLPKGFYKEHITTNPRTGGMKVEKKFGWVDNETDRKMMPVEGGGRVDTFDEVIPSEYIQRVCFDGEGNRCYTPKQLKTLLDEYNEWGEMHPADEKTWLHLNGEKK